MNKNAVLTLVGLFLLSACSSDQNNDQKSAQQKNQQKWTMALSDSLNTTQQAIEQTNQRLVQERQQLDSLLKKFDIISNKHYVESYTVYHGWSGYNTSAQTGVLLRLTQNFELEMVVTLKGNSFNRIELVTASGKRQSSKTVVHDQALNYKIGSTSVVAFKGNELDSICQLAFLQKNEQLKLVMLNNNKSVSSINLSEKQKEMICATFKLWKTQQTIKNDELQLPYLSEKLKILQTKIESDK